MKQSTFSAATQATLPATSRWELFLRRMRWVFLKSGLISLALEHFLAMIPATILVPVLVNNAFDTMVIDMSLVLFTSGVGTLLFTLLSRGAIPAYLGSSFAYIGLTIYLIQENMTEGVSHAAAYSYVGWSYIFSGLLLILLSFLYRKRGIERFLSFLLPATVVGPAISLIGLELADTAVVDAGFDIEDGLVDGTAALVALVTLGIIVLFSLLHHRILKNAAIIVGMVVGCTLFFALNGFPTESFSDIRWFTAPDFHLPLLSLPPNLPGLLIAVVPSTFIVFTENIGRVTVIGRMTAENEEPTDEISHPGFAGESVEVIDDDTGEGELFTERSVRKMRTSLLSHGVATLAAGMMGSVPNTIYAENVAVMSIHKTDVKREDPDRFIKRLVDPFSPMPYIMAASFAILFSFIGILQTFLLNIPKPVIGGMELFLFGIISAPGIQLLVEQRVNYKKISNQMITAAVLISGISGLSVNFGIVELKGMGLGFVVGVLLNLLVQLLKWAGNISDLITFEEMVGDCLSSFSADTPFRILGYRTEGGVGVDYAKNAPISGFAYALSGKDCRVRMPDGHWISDDTIRDEIQHADLLEVGTAGGRALLRLRKTANGLFVDLHIDTVSPAARVAYLNDYDAIDEEGEWLLMNLSDGIPMRRIRHLIRGLDAAARM